MTLLPTAAATPTLIPPIGDRLVNLLVPDEAQKERIAYANRLPSFQVSERVVCDLELLAVGPFHRWITFSVGPITSGW